MTHCVVPVTECRGVRLEGFRRARAPRRPTRSVPNARADDAPDHVRRLSCEGRKADAEDSAVVHHLRANQRQGCGTTRPRRLDSDTESDIRSGPPVATWPTRAVPGKEGQAPHRSARTRVRRGMETNMADRLLRLGVCIDLLVRLPGQREVTLAAVDGRGANRDLVGLRRRPRGCRHPGEELPCAPPAAPRPSSWRPLWRRLVCLLLAGRPAADPQSPAPAVAARGRGSVGLSRATSSTRRRTRQATAPTDELADVVGHSARRAFDGSPAWPPAPAVACALGADAHAGAAGDRDTVEPALP